jgi:DNA primase
MDAVEDIKSRLAIEDVIGEYVQLKRAGRNFKGLSPFTSEKTASFMVSPEKAIWHDFSSGKGGNIFSFVMEMEGLDFRGALELLARKAGIDLAQYGPSGSDQNTKLKNKVYAALELATKFYQVQFSKNQPVLDYVIKKRAFKKQVVLDFKLGYSPNIGDSLYKFLSKKGFTKQELREAGLITTNYRQPSDMFRARLMIPLADAQGRIIGFTARYLGTDNSAPKYINTPKTVVYDKSRHVYGLDQAKEAIRKAGFAVVAEGNLDVIASHQAGIKQVVATAGTALTEQHLKILSNFTNDIRLAFDQDKAGQAATERAIPIASKVGVNLSIIPIKEGKDPDELIRTNPLIWQNAINEPVYALDWLIDTYKSQIDLSQAVGKRKFSDVILPVVSKLVDPVERDHYLTNIAKLINVSKEALASKAKISEDKTSTRLKRRQTPNKELDKEEIEQIKNQDQLLSIGLINDHLRMYLEPLTKDMFIGKNAPVVFSFLNKNSDFKGDPLMVEALKNHTDYVKMLMLQYEALYQNLDKTDLDYESKLLQDRLITKYVKTQKDSLSAAMQAADEKETQKLLNQAKGLDNLLKQTREVVNG